MNDRILKSLTRHLLALVISITPAEAREWSDALTAEVNAIPHPREAFAWAVGGLSFTLGSRLRSVFFGKRHLVDRRTFAFIFAFALVVAVVAMLPGFRDAFTIIPRTATLTNDYRIVSRQLSEFAATAEAKGDARSMAFAAMELQDANRGMILADKAIALDPQLSWIKFFVIKQDWRFDLRRSTFAAESSEVAAADPDNALSHLLVAESIRRSDPSLNRRHAEWQVAMERAFAAPRYDDYLNRKLDLEREIIRDHHLGPLVAMYSVMGSSVADLESIKRYSDQLLANGDPESCLRVLRFSAQLQQGQATFLTFLARGLNERASKVLADKLGVPEVGHLSPRMTRPANLAPFILTDSLVVQIGFDIAVLMTFSIVVCAGLLMFGNRQSIVRSALRISSVVGTIAVISATLAYLPFASAYSQFLQAPNASSAFQYLTPFASFAIVGNSEHYLFTGPAAQYFFWMLVIVLGTSLVMWRGVLFCTRPKVRTA